VRIIPKNRSKIAINAQRMMTVSRLRSQIARDKEFLANNRGNMITEVAQKIKKQIAAAETKLKEV
tara:strand:+ start:15647 stop:15841 length:195 start_codon:yes stop_codon:yes gene_type:complete